MIAILVLPLAEQIYEIALYRLLKVQIAIVIKLPHLRAELNEDVNLSCGRPKRHLRIYLELCNIVNRRKQHLNISQSKMIPPVHCTWTRISDVHLPFGNVCYSLYRSDYKK